MGISISDFEDDDQESYDFSWQRDDHELYDRLLPHNLTVEWKVDVRPDGRMRVDKLGTFSDADPQREAFLKTAAELQKKYLQSGSYRDLRVLSCAEVLAACPDRSGHADVLRDVDADCLTQWIGPEYFYAVSLKNAPHAFSFLLQDEILGLPETYVLHTLGTRLAEEPSTTWSDRELAADLFMHLEFVDPRQSIGEADIRRLRKRFFWFPGSPERRARRE